MSNRDADLGFTFEINKTGEVRIAHHGRVVTVLRNRPAQKFSAKAAVLSYEQLQQQMARITGHYKHGNQRAAKNAKGPFTS